MRGASTIRRIGGCLMAAAALAGATAGSASAMAMPTCTTELVGAVASSSQCGFGNISTSYATITVAPVGTVTATVRCFTSYGTTYTTTRTVSSTSSWRAYAPGSGCSLILTAVTPGASAVGNAAPGLGPIIDPGPYGP